MIRDARPDDVPALLTLIQELAVYEREPDVVETTAADLDGALFGAPAAVFALVAEQDGQVVGCAIWFVTFSTWTGRPGIHLEDLVVTASARADGHGRALLQALAGICVERDYRRLEWAVLDWNEPALGFYRALGAATVDHWIVHRVAGAALAELAG